MRMNRRIFEGVIVIVVLWDLAKGSIRLWERKTWATAPPGSPLHATADLTSIFVG
jgi:hypothetical protein